MYFGNINTKEGVKNEDQTNKQKFEQALIWLGIKRNDIQRAVAALKNKMNLNKIRAKRKISG
jgi:Holliday junction resolvasome RuvABC DNA-binding subunit